METWKLAVAAVVLLLLVAVVIAVLPDAVVAPAAGPASLTAAQPMVDDQKAPRKPALVAAKAAPARPRPPSQPRAIGGAPMPDASGGGPTLEMEPDADNSTGGTGLPADRDTGVSGHQEMPEEASPNEGRDALMGYNRIYQRMLAGDLVGVKAASARLGQHRGAIGSRLVLPARKLARARNLKEARLAFAVLARIAIDFAQTEPHSSAGAQAYRCATKDGEQTWLQVSGPVANPFGDGAARHCGTKVPLDP